MLKVDFHTHTNYVQNFEGKYSPKELIDSARKKGFDILCITEHGSYSYYGGKKYFDYLKTYNDFKDYALSKGLLLVSGVEIEIEGKEVLLVNFKGDVTKLNNFSDLKNLGNEVLVIAPHPYYYVGNCLMGELVKQISLFDAIEYSHFHTKFINWPNKKVLKVAKKYNKVLVGTSDAHRMYQFGRCYSLVDCAKDVNSLVKAVKKGKVKIVAKPFGIIAFFKIFVFFVLFGKMKKYLYNLGLLKV